MAKLGGPKSVTAHYDRLYRSDPKISDSTKKRLIFFIGSGERRDLIIF
jgi:hypothetical protein